MFNPGINILMGAINPGETAVLCCPGTMTPNSQGYCHSTLPSYRVTKGVEFIIPRGDIGTISDTSISAYGTTVAADILTFVAASPVTSRRTTEFNPPPSGRAFRWCPWLRSSTGPRTSRPRNPRLAPPEGWRWLLTTAMRGCCSSCGPWG